MSENLRDYFEGELPRDEWIKETPEEREKILEEILLGDGFEKAFDIEGGHPEYEFKGMKLKGVSPFRTAEAIAALRTLIIELKKQYFAKMIGNPYQTVEKGNIGRGIGQIFRKPIFRKRPLFWDFCDCPWAGKWSKRVEKGKMTLRTLQNWWKEFSALENKPVYHLYFS